MPESSPPESAASLGHATWRPLRLRVPRHDDAILAAPSLTEFPALLAANQKVLTDADLTFQTRSLHDLRHSARTQALDAARQYTRDVLGMEHAAGENPSPSDSVPLICTGHQPELFHPGVWIKNFACASLAQQSGGVGLNLIVDSDVVTSRQIRVPSGSRTEPTITAIPFDDPQPAQPWEDAAIGSPHCFRAFPAKLSAALQAWDITPLGSKHWPTSRLDAGELSLRDAFVQLRGRVERLWGAGTLELPLSVLCETEACLWFASHLFAHAERFAAVHNQVLGEYRRLNRIRSQTHPVPALSATGGWQETPFWYWRTDDTSRRPLSVQRLGDCVRIGQPQDVLCEFPLAVNGSACCAVEALQQLPAQGIRLRTRALTTTLFARMCLSDAFIHGIGGAKYDEMTDEILRRFFRLQPPAFVTLSATKFLRLGKPFAVTGDDLRRSQQELSHLQDSPERGIAEITPEVKTLIERKREIIADQARLREETTESQPASLTRARQRKTLHRELQSINQQLQPFAEPAREQLQRQVVAMQQELAANQILTHREFSFACYPEPALRSFLTESLAGA